MKFTKYLYQSLEKTLGQDHFFQNDLPIEFDLTSYEPHTVEYFKKYGFKISSVYKDVFEMINGIRSEKYIPPELYLFYIVPFLNNTEMTSAYVDKNAYSFLFPQERQPYTVVKKSNGLFFDARDVSLNFQESIEVLANCKECCIAKPTLPPDTHGTSGTSGCASDFKVFIPSKLNKNEITDFLNDYNRNFIVQVFVNQHTVLKQFNPTSLNTVRIHTYRRPNKELVCFGSILRFGKLGSYFDSARQGGGYCRIFDDGKVDDVIRSGKTIQTSSLKERYGIVARIPNFGKVKELVLRCHQRLTFLDLCGWDVAISEDGEPVLIECNNYPDCEFVQRVHGPMFGEYTDELMEQIQGSKTCYSVIIKRTYLNGRESSVLLKDDVK